MTRQDEERGKPTEERDKSNDMVGNRKVPHLAKISVGTLLAYCWGILSRFCLLLN